MQLTRARSKLRATLSVGLTLVLAAGLSLAGAAPANATAAVLCKGYAACADYGMTNHGYSAKAGNSYWRMYGGHNCTNYAAYMMVKAGMANTRPWSNATGDAAGWGVGLKTKTNTTPKVGSIAWWNGGSGHVAHVEAVLSPTEIVISEDNWGGDFYWRVINKASGGWPKGFIHLRDSAAKNVMPEYRAKSVATTVWTDSTKRTLANTAVMNPGSTAWVELSYLNTGLTTWTGLQLATQAPEDRDSDLAQNWLTPARAAVQVPASVTTGGTATFGFAIRIPAGLANGTKIAEKFSPVLGATGARLEYGTKTLALTADSRKLFTTTPVPTVKGTAGEEQILTATPGTWKPAGAQFSYVWKRNGVTISGQTGSTYALTAYDVGRSVTVTVTAKASNFISVAKTSVSTPIVTSKFGHTLDVGTTLAGGGQIVSQNGKFRLFQKVDGPLIIQNRLSGATTWTSKKSAKGTYTTITASGNLAVYSKAGTLMWRSGTTGKGVVRVYLTNTGEMRLLTAKSTIVWKVS